MARRVSSPSSEVDRVTTRQTGSRGGIRSAEALAACAAGLLVWAVSLASAAGGFSGYHSLAQYHERASAAPGLRDVPSPETGMWIEVSGGPRQPSLIDMAAVGRRN